jgi:RNA polymerase sigma factor (sigma-70 family)
MAVIKHSKISGIEVTWANLAQFGTTSFYRNYLSPSFEKVLERKGEKGVFVRMYGAGYRTMQRWSHLTDPEKLKEKGEYFLYSSTGNDIIQKNEGLAFIVARRFIHGGEDGDEIISDAKCALARAAVGFNPWKGYRFSTYACTIIARDLMRRAKRNANRRRLFPVQHDPAFERGEIARKSDKEVYRLDVLRRVLDRNLGSLTELESRVLGYRFPEDRGEDIPTFQEIGNLVGLSKERVRQIQNVALQKLRVEIERIEAVEDGKSSSMQESAENF